MFFMAHGVVAAPTAAINGMCNINVFTTNKQEN